MKKTCKKYELDLMHYAGGEYNYIKDKDGLEQHLKTCPVCQKVLKGFIEVDTFAAATREPSKQFQEKMAGLRERARKGPPPLEAVSPKGVTASYPPMSIGGLPPARNTDWEMGIAAMEIHNYLKENGPTSIPLLRVKTKLVNYPFRESVGWLAREKKITIHGDPVTGYASLPPPPQPQP